MEKPSGFKCPGSHVGRPHGGDKKRERALRTKARLEAMPPRMTAQRVAELDRRLGKGIGAKRERTRLARDRRAA